MGEGGWLTRRLRSLTADESELDADELQDDVAQAGAEPVSACTCGEKVVIRGRLKTVVFKPKETTPTLEAELFDGSGTVTLVWLGQRQIAGIEPGRVLEARGRLAERDGQRLLFNPWYKLEPAGT